MEDMIQRQIEGITGFEMRYDTPTPKQDLKQYGTPAPIERYDFDV